MGREIPQYEREQTMSSERLTEQEMEMSWSDIGNIFNSIKGNAEYILEILNDEGIEAAAGDAKTIFKEQPDFEAYVMGLEHGNPLAEQEEKTDPAKAQKYHEQFIQQADSERVKAYNELVAEYNALIERIKSNLVKEEVVQLLDIAEKGRKIAQPEFIRAV